MEDYESFCAAVKMLNPASGAQLTHAFKKNLLWLYYQYF